MKFRGMELVFVRKTMRGSASSNYYVFCCCFLCKISCQECAFLSFLCDFVSRKCTRIEILLLTPLGLQVRLFILLKRKSFSCLLREFRPSKSLFFGRGRSDSF